tara:strand:+ start:842 stop:973 length:132 start_codon:yes stop_codon:yes gene_type:complete
VNSDEHISDTQNTVALATARTMAEIIDAIEQIKFSDGENDAKP